jgi:hypothetical protein
MKIITDKQEEKIKGEIRTIRLYNSILREQQRNILSSLNTILDLIESVEQGIIKSMQEQF